MARKVNKIDNSFGKYGLGVAARPVDTFVSPERPREADDAGGDYRQLAAALSTVHRPLTAYLKTKHDEQVEADVAKGHQLYTDDSHGGLSWEDWTKRNPEIAVNQSVKRGYLMARNGNNIKKLELQMTEAYNRGEAVVMVDGNPVDVSQTDDLNTYLAWEREFIKKFIDENVGDDTPPDIYLGVFQPQLGAVSNSVMKMHESKRNQEYIVKSAAEASEFVDNVYLGAVEDGVFDYGGPEGFRAMSAQLGAIADNLIAQGFTTKDAFGIITDKAMSLAANLDVESGEKLLQVVKEVSTQDGTRIGALGGLEAALTRQFYTIQGEREREEERKKRELIRQGTNDVFFGFLKSRKYDRNSLIALENIPGIDFHTVNSLDSAMKTMSERWKPTVDASARAESVKNQAARERFAFRAKYRNGASLENVIEAINSGEISSWSTAETLAKEIDEMDTPLNNVLKNNSSLIDDTLGARIPKEDFDTWEAARAKIVLNLEEALRKNPDFAYSTYAQESTIRDTAKEIAKEYTAKAPVIQNERNKGASVNDIPKYVEDSRKPLSIIGTNPGQDYAAKTLYEKYRYALQVGDSITAQKILAGLRELDVDIEYFESVYNAYQ